MSEEKKDRVPSEHDAKDEAAEAAKSPGPAPMGGGDTHDEPMGGGPAKREESAGSKVDHLDEEDE